MRSRAESLGRPAAYQVNAGTPFSRRTVNQRTLYSARNSGGSAVRVCVRQSHFSLLRLATISFEQPKTALDTLGPEPPA